MPPPYEDPKLVMPAPGIITGRFGEMGPDYPPGGHRGVDIANDESTLIVGCAAGPVVAARNDGSFGITVCIDIPRTRYFALCAHMKRALVSPGDVVGQGQPIGLMGSTGRATGVHTHWELSDSTDFPPDISHCVDPMRYLIAAAEPPESHVGRKELAAVQARLTALEARLDPAAFKAELAEAVERLAEAFMAEARRLRGG